MTTWDDSVDVVVVGSGGGGMVAALTAADAGATVLMLEKQDRLGGSTAMSGGIVWVPNNPVMLAEGVPDSYEDALAHFEAVVGDVGPASSLERRHAFLSAGPEMISFLQRSVFASSFAEATATTTRARRAATTSDEGSSPSLSTVGNWVPGSTNSSLDSLRASVWR